MKQPGLSKGEVKHEATPFLKYSHPEVDKTRGYLMNMWGFCRRASSIYSRMAVG